MKTFLIDVQHLLYNEPIGIGITIVYNIFINKSQNAILHLNDYCADCLETRINDLHRAIKTFKPDYIGISTRCDTYPFVIYLANCIKHYSDAIIFLGGPQATITDVETLSSYTFIDFIVRGEAEVTISNFIDNYSIDPKSYKRLNGITYRNDTVVIANPDEKLLSSLEYCAYISNYPRSYLENILKRNVGIRMEIGRGCPYSCGYCSTSKFWQHSYRIKENDIVLKEMNEIQRITGINYFVFEHDNLLANPKRVNALLNSLHIQQSLNPISWSCSTRLDHLSLSVIEKLEAAGCSQLFIGVESTNQETLDHYNKNYSVSELEKIDLLNNSSMKFILSFIIGSLMDTQDILNDTLLSVLKYKQYLNCEAVQIHRLSIHPGTNFYTLYSDYLVFDLNRVSDQVETAYLNSWMVDEIKKHPEIFSSFYSINLGQTLNNIIDNIFSSWKVYIDYYYRTAYLFSTVTSVEPITMFEQLENSGGNFLKLINETVQDQFYKEKLIDLFEFEKSVEEFERYCMYNIDAEIECFKVLKPRFNPLSLSHESSNEDVMILHKRPRLPLSLRKVNRYQLSLIKIGAKDSKLTMFLE